MRQLYSWATMDKSAVLTHSMSSPYRCNARFTTAGSSYSKVAITLGDFLENIAKRGKREVEGWEGLSITMKKRGHKNMAHDSFGFTYYFFRRNKYDADGLHFLLFGIK